MPNRKPPSDQPSTVSGPAAASGRRDTASAITAVIVASAYGAIAAL